MNKPNWKHTAICLITIIILSVTILPLVVNAEVNLQTDGKWSEESPNFSNYYAFNQNDYSLQTIRDFATGIDFAYDGGMFGGSIPIAIMLVIENSYQYIEIVTLAQQANPSQISMGSKRESRATTICTINQGLSANFSTLDIRGNTATYPTSKIIRYRVCNNGDFVPMAIGDTITYTYNDMGIGYSSKILAIGTGYIANEYNEDTTAKPTEEYSTLFDIGNWYISREMTTEKSDPRYFFLPAYNTPESENIEQWAEQLKEKYAYNGESYQGGYERGYNDGYEVGYDDGYEVGLETDEEPITLNIASIFTSMFSGVRSIFNGFNLNIFGISIAGMLLAILLINIIAFVIKKIK